MADGIGRGGRSGRWCAMLVLTFAMACRQAVGATPAGGNAGVLFIGNSLTYTNDLPGLVAAVARAGGVAIEVRSLVAPNRALIDFVFDGSASRTIGGGKWRYVVMQQGPSTVPICRDTLVVAVQQLARWATEVGASSVIMMPWPSTARPQDFPRVRESAQMAANSVGGRLAPAGEAWRLALTSDPQLPLYGGDGYHPAPLGSWLAALVLYEQLTGGDARALADSALRANGLTAASRVLTTLRDAAHAATDSVRAHAAPAWTPSVPPVPGIGC